MIIVLKRVFIILFLLFISSIIAFFNVLLYIYFILLEGEFKMDNKVKKYLRTFLEMSEVQINIRENAIKRKNSWKRILDTSKANEVNERIMELIEEKHKIEGQLDCVRLEMLDIILEDSSLISDDLLYKMDCHSVDGFVEREKEKIKQRGLYAKYPCSIADVLNTALSFNDENHSIKITQNETKIAVNVKNVKIMIKNLKSS